YCWGYCLRAVSISPGPTCGEDVLELDLSRSQPLGAAAILYQFGHLHAELGRRLGAPYPLQPLDHAGDPGRHLYLSPSARSAAGSVSHGMIRCQETGRSRAPPAHSSDYYLACVNCAKSCPCQTRPSRITSPL